MKIVFYDEYTKLISNIEESINAISIHVSNGQKDLLTDRANFYSIISPFVLLDDSYLVNIGEILTNEQQQADLSSQYTEISELDRLSNVEAKANNIEYNLNSLTDYTSQNVNDLQLRCSTLEIQVDLLKRQVQSLATQTGLTIPQE